MKYSSAFCVKFLVRVVACVLLVPLLSCDKDDDDNNDYPFDENLLAGTYIADKYFIDNNELDMETDLKLTEYRIVYNSDGSGYKQEKFLSYTKTDTIQWKMSATKEYIYKRFSIGGAQWTEWVTNQRILKLTENNLHVVFESQMEERKIFFIKNDE